MHENFWYAPYGALHRIPITWWGLRHKWNGITVVQWTTSIALRNSLGDFCHDRAFFLDRQNSLHKAFWGPIPLQSIRPCSRWSTLSKHCWACSVPSLCQIKWFQQVRAARRITCGSLLHPGRCLPCSSFPLRAWRSHWGPFKHLKRLPNSMQRPIFRSSTNEILVLWIDDGIGGCDGHLGRRWNIWCHLR